MTTVEALADMTPEQLEAIEGIGPKTVEKISLAVNNYFASLDAGVVEGEIPAEGLAAEGEAVGEEISAEAAPEAAVEVADGEVAADEAAAAPEATAEAEAASGEPAPEKNDEHEPKADSAPETTE